MIEHYFAVKHLHMAAAYASLVFFIVRAYWSVTERPILKGALGQDTPPYHRYGASNLRRAIGHHAELLATSAMAQRQNHRADCLYTARYNGD